MTPRQAFDILGIHERNIDEAGLKRAFYSAARRTHPDSNPDDAEAEEKFQLINEAYAVLLDYIKLQDRTKRGPRTFGRKPDSTTKASAAGSRKTGSTTDSTRASDRKPGSAAKASTASGRQTARATDSTRTSGGKTGRTTDSTRMSGSAAETARHSSAYSEKDIWRAYNEADIRFAKQRHDDASERATETIRNHMRRENEQAAQEAKERAARELEEAERRMREEQDARQHAPQEQRRRAHRRQRLRAVRRFERSLMRFWNTHITANRRLVCFVLWLLVLILILWAGTVIFGASGALAAVAQTLAVIAKWILIVWMSAEVTVVVHRSWKNRILSTFAFLVSMELVIILMNWLEDVVRGMASHL